MSIHHGERPTQTPETNVLAGPATTEEFRTNDTSAEPAHKPDSTIDLGRIARVREELEAPAKKEKRPYSTRTKALLAGTALGLTLVGGVMIGRGGNNDVDAKAPPQPEVTTSAPAFSSQPESTVQLPPAYGNTAAETQPSRQRITAEVPILAPGEFPELPKGDTAKGTMDDFLDIYNAGVNSVDENGQPRVDILSTMYSPQAEPDLQDALRTQASFNEFRKTNPGAKYFATASVMSTEPRATYGIHGTHQGFRSKVQFTTYFLDSDNGVLHASAAPLFQEWETSGPDQKAITPDGRTLTGARVLSVKTIPGPNANVVGSPETN